ncbi:hypothetical protein LJY25_19565 [Hymenobacter sp. BT175]|uniref:MbnP family protein n=1 Tax=Hymenobacter translucens TaxID=2886507 RepID=UPI001D0F31C9|nr:MbnP family protein [Hymenobacter translucens]MCC2548656.1 hypothetical protein [Hymenobacter translucens]
MAVLAACSLTSCEDDDPKTETGAVSIRMDHVVGTAPLVLGSTRYAVGSGDSLTVSAFSYFVSNIRLRRQDGTEYAAPSSYFLVKESDAASKTLVLKDVPPGDYASMSFLLGVDSTRTVTEAPAGSLDPTSTMYWPMTREYIFLKLEGTSRQSPSSALLFHIAGYRKPVNTLRTITLPFTGSSLPVRQGKTPQVHVKADILKALTGPNPIRFATVYSTMSGSNTNQNMLKIADNYAAGMFRVDHIMAN